MNNDKKELFRNLAMVSSMGISVVLAIAIGVWFGLTLDRWFGTKPWFFYIFLLSESRPVSRISTSLPAGRSAGMMTNDKRR